MTQNPNPVCHDHFVLWAYQHHFDQRTILNEAATQPKRCIRSYLRTCDKSCVCTYTLPDAGDLRRVGNLYDAPPGWKDDLIVWDFFWTRMSCWDARAALVSPHPTADRVHRGNVAHRMRFHVHYLFHASLGKAQTKPACIALDMCGCSNSERQQEAEIWVLSPANRPD